MTHLLWKYYWEDDLEKFCALLAPAPAYGAQSVGRSPNLGTLGGAGHGSVGAFGTSPRASSHTKSRRVSGPGMSHGRALGKNEVNSRDHAGLTILLRAASSTSENALAFVRALLDHPSIDIHVQDPESGWNALHRSLYTGNVSTALCLLHKERETHIYKAGQLMKTKDHEGNSPFELYNSTIGERALKVIGRVDSYEGASDSDVQSDLHEDGPAAGSGSAPNLADGDELFAFGSNKNISLGFNDSDDRQFPERVNIERPDHLLLRFHNEYLEQVGLGGQATLHVAKIPTLIRNRPLMIRDVALSKLHSAVITSDPVSNLYVCGIGRGGRLGLGNENTQFTFTPVQGGLVDKMIVEVKLGLHHTMAITKDGELWTWGDNSLSQLGYTLAQPISVTPRQVFGPLKKEVILGIAASSVHSVAHTGSSLYCWGKNTGQLALMDADSRSLDIQTTPRKVAPSVISGETILEVSAIDKATTVLLKNHFVFVLTAYGYVKLNFSETSPLNSLGKFSIATRYDASRHEIQHITSGGDGTIAAVTTRGDLFTASLAHKTETNPALGSTTQPSKIKGAVTTPHCIWSEGRKKDGVRSVSIGANGSVIFATESGAVWRRVERISAKHGYNSGAVDSKSKDYKFQRVPGLTRIVTVRASSFGAFAAIRKDSDVMKHEIHVDPPHLLEDVASLSCLRGFKAAALASDHDEAKYQEFKTLGSAACEMMKSTDIETDLLAHLNSWKEPFDTYLCTDVFPEAKIPVFGWVLCARSSVLRAGFTEFRVSGKFELPDGFAITRQHDGDGSTRTLVTFHSLDIYALLSLTHFIFFDKTPHFWNTRHAALAYRFRQVRSQTMKIASFLNMAQLEYAVRHHVDPKKSMHLDFQRAADEPSFFELDSDVILELDGIDVPVHGVLVCQRCPWFQGLFNGRSGGGWLASRREAQSDSERTRIDLKDMDPGAFSYVLKYLYGDFGTELFDTIADSFDELTGLVLDVLGMADFLMLDRLSQICQRVLGRIVTTRNLSRLLNEISPYSVSEFKNAGLKYVCLQLENFLLGTHLLDLDHDLLRELDQVVRQNQASQFPFSKSGRATLLLHQRHPELAEEISEERQRRVREMAFKTAQKERLSTSIKARCGSLDTPSITPDRRRKVSIEARHDPCSPELKAKDSNAELVFAMDEDSAIPHSPSTRPQMRQDPMIPLDLSGSWKGGLSKTPQDVTESAQRNSLSTPAPHNTLPYASSPRDVPFPQAHGARVGNPWGTSGAAMPKLDLRDIIHSESSGRSALSAGLAAQKAKDGALKPVQGRVSQKERKKKQQEAQVAQAVQAAQPTVRDQRPSVAWEKSPSGSQPALSLPEKTSVKDMLSTEERPRAPASTLPASPDTRFPGQSRDPTANPQAVRPVARPTQTTNSQGSSRAFAREGLESQTPSKPLVPHSKSYLPLAPRAEQILGLSMTDIIGQQKREQEVVKEAIAKRSLQEIQTEQEFEQWWEAESRRTQEEEARRLSKEQGKEDSEKGAGRRGRRAKTRSESGPSRAVGKVSERGIAESQALRARVKGKGRSTAGGTSQ